ncbi:sensor histidine kinase [Marinirhabdus gelatinilytica]|uniref:histidine kinase n=1 Tax=Marinirhabdus gelatinilytica TaxID=1703343 RepID=A0A370QKF6_9FLAO|nr:HAMP domain-containing sensor histidine kinase [Marinirhabdus gelatinilytica]RDK88811.1 phospho-acceptor domain-containing protein [Marinirhabdus gelatinilytica]
MNKRIALRWIFVVASIMIISLVAYNTYSFLNRLKENEREKMKIWASAQQDLEEFQLSESMVMSPVVLKVIESNTTTPMVVHKMAEDIYDYRNIKLEKLDSTQLRNKLIALSKEYAQEYKPLEVTYKDKLLTTIYYGNSPIINKIKYYPALLIIIIVLMFVTVYFFLQTAKSSDQNKLWAGMAKETAHQIGTPLSSLVGWTEILKTENVNPEYIAEIEKDVDRLQTITERFSKIGSIPTLEKSDIVQETVKAYEYLKSRSSKLIDFEIEVPSEPIFVHLNPQLYGWTIENLVKNSIDAMKGKGKIYISIANKNDKVFIEVTDTGKGIPKRDFKRVFSPGFTTKKRGWGLGLSLVKRIIEEYHNGKIRVLKSSPKTGTTMSIMLRQTH